MTTLAPSFQIERTKQTRIGEVDFQNLEFGKIMSDHMVHSDFANGKWGEPTIIPFGDLRMSPAMLSIHYGQAVFEGLKAFYMKDGRINVFRPHRHSQRLNKSLARMCMPDVSEEMFIQSTHALIETDKAWVPKSDGSSLYIRPVVFATESRLGVKVSDTYKYMVLTTPTGAYLNKPFKLKVEDSYVRTAEGSPGFAKCAGNYGGAFYPTALARQQGFDQILWTDHKEHKYIDEVGMMNVMFVINGVLVTPMLSSAILDGVTRDSILTLAKDMGMKTEERRVSLDEIEQGFQDGSVSEAFGAGTAAVVATIEVINIRGKDHKISTPKADSFQNRVKEKLNDIRLGVAPDVHGWNYIIG